MSKLYASGQPICPEHPRRSCLRNRASATLGGASALCERFTSFSCHLSSYTTPTSKGNPRKELCVCHTPVSSVVVDSEYLHRQTYPSILQNEDTAVCCYTQRHNMHMAICSLPLSGPLLTQGNEVLLSQHVRIFPSPLSRLSKVLAYLLPSSFRYITDVPTRQKHPTAAPSLPENLVELFSQYPRFTFKTPVFTQAPYLYTAAYSLP